MAYNLLTEKPRNILLPRFDTLGDLVLLEGLVETLRQMLPQSRITLLVRRAYGDLSSLFPEPLEWLVTDIDPHSADPEPTSCESLLQHVGSLDCNLILFTAHNRTWADNLLAAKHTQAHRIAIGNWVEMLPHQRAVFSKLGISSANPYTQMVEVPQRLHESGKYNLLWKALGGEFDLPDPRLRVNEHQDFVARQILENLNLGAKQFCFCFPAGTQKVAIKVWPAERFADIIAHLEGERGLPSLIAGHNSEAAQIKHVAELARGKGANPRVWLGRDGEVPLLAALSALAALYLGNDTGPMHIAAAVGTPAVSIFGGGTWPRFIPRGEKSVAIAGEMPCFGCGWDCMFGDAPCMTLVTREDVRSTVNGILGYSAPIIAKNRIVSASARLSRQSWDLIAKAFQIHKEIQEDRRARLQTIDQLGKQLQECEADRAERIKAIEGLDRRLEESEADRAARLILNEAQGKQLQESEIDRATRLDVIQGLSKQLEESDADRAARLQVIEELKVEKGALEARNRQLESVRSHFLVRALIGMGLVREARVLRLFP